MKIEIGESLIYSWLRHDIGCQIVQTNWRPSKEWRLQHEEEIGKLRDKSHAFFSERYGYDIYGRLPLKSLLSGTECDAFGIKIAGSKQYYYAVEIAFHENGLNYSGKTIQKVIGKCFRSAMCIYAFFGIGDAEVIFSTPKVQPGVKEKLEKCFTEANTLVKDAGFDFTFRLILGDDFKEEVLLPVLQRERNISDTNELFVRSYQMMALYDDISIERHKQKRQSQQEKDGTEEIAVGRIVQTQVRAILESGRVSEREIEQLQDKEYCSRELSLSFPMLVRYSGDYERIRYYVKPVVVNGEEYVLCSQWFKQDRPYIMKWIAEHEGK